MLAERKKLLSEKQAALDKALADDEEDHAKIAQLKGELSKAKWDLKHHKKAIFSFQ